MYGLPMRNMKALLILILILAQNFIGFRSEIGPSSKPNSDALMGRGKKWEKVLTINDYGWL